MKNLCVSIALLALFNLSLFAQSQPPPPPRAAQNANSNVTDLSQYGVRIQPDARLIIVMAALDTAGFNPNGDSEFQQLLRKDMGALDPDLRRRMHDFFERSKKAAETLRQEEIKRANPSLTEAEIETKAKLSLTDQAARFVSLAYALTPAPDLSEPARSSDLPGELLEVLDFAPLVREFYRKSGIEDRLPDYTRKYQAAGDRLRPQISKSVSDMAAYLNTRPQLAITERVKTTTSKTNLKGKQKEKLQNVEVREHERNFYVVPDLLAVPNSVKFRVIGDNYFAVVGEQVQPETSPELRRAYLQFLIDPIIYKNAKEIAAQRDAIRGILDERIKAGASASPDVYLTISRSLVAASEIRERKQKRIAIATFKAQADAANKRQANTEEVEVVKNRLTFPNAKREAFEELSEAYENGAVLVFFFDEQLSGLEHSSFDVTSSFAEMLASFDAAKEKGRLSSGETAARKEALASLAKRRAENRQRIKNDESTGAEIRGNELIKDLNDVEKILEEKDYEKAESSLMGMLQKFPGEPRILFALGRTASLSATGVFDEELRNARLNKALTHYQSVLKLQNEDTPKSLISNTHVALGKIYEFYQEVMDENKAAYKEAAIKQFDAAIALGRVDAAAYTEAIAGKARLSK